VIDDYYATYKGVRRYMDEIPVQAREHGYVRSLYGRIRPLAESTIATRISGARLSAKQSTCRSKALPVTSLRLRCCTSKMPFGAKA